MSEPIATPSAPEAVKSKEDLAQFIGNKDGNTLVIDGPLSRAYSDSLQELYGKKHDPISGLALETQAIDALHSQMEYIEKQAGNIFLDNEAQNLGLLYGVEKGSTSPEELMEVTDFLSVMTPMQKNKSAIIIDSAIVNGNTGQIPEVTTVSHNPFETALEQLCLNHKVTVYHSFESFIKMH